MFPKALKKPKVNQMLTKDCNMFRKEINRLEKLRDQYQSRLDSIHDADADPNVKAVYQSDLQHQIVKLDAAIEYEKCMLPFKYTTAVFIIFVIGLVIYRII